MAGAEEEAVADKNGKKKKTGRYQAEDLPVDIKVGSWSLGGFLKGFGGFVQSLDELAKKGEALKKQGEFTVPGPDGKPLRGLYGFTIRTLVGGQPVVETFGNIKPTPRGPEVQDVREPLVDAYEEKGDVVVLGELPGVEENQIHWELKGDVLKLEASNGTRKYGKEVVLPASVTGDPPKTSFKNGVFELRFCKKVTGRKETKNK
jgi:HSP20 family protein